MYPIKRVMIGLDFTLMDKGLIRFASALTELVEPEDIYFINIQPELELPQEIAEAFPVLMEEPAEHLRQNMLEEIERNFPNHGQWKDRIHTMVIEGSPRKEFLHQAEDLDVDLIVMGRKKNRNGTGIVPTQVANKAKCSVLFLPETPPEEINQIVVGCDFSEPARLALEEALTLRKRASHEVNINMVHVYHVPMGYYKTGRTESQFAALMRQNAEKRLVKFTEQYELDLTGVKIHFVYGRKKSPAAVLKKMAKRHQANLIIVSARGLGGPSAFLLGSTTEKLLKMVDDQAILVVKDNDASPSFREIVEQI